MHLYFIHLSDGSDEENCKPLAFEVILVFVGIGALLIVIFGYTFITIQNLLRKREKDIPQIEKISPQSFRSIPNIDQESFTDRYKRWRTGASPAKYMCIENHLIYHSLASDANTAIRICQELYKQEELFNNGDI